MTSTAEASSSTIDLLRISDHHYDEVINRVTRSIGEDALKLVAEEVHDYHRNRNRSHHSITKLSAVNGPQHGGISHDSTLLEHIYNMLSVEPEDHHFSLRHPLSPLKKLVRHGKKKSDKPPPQVDHVRHNISTLKEKVKQLMTDGSSFLGAQWNVFLNFLQAWSTPLESLWNSFKVFNPSHIKSLVKCAIDIARTILSFIKKSVKEAISLMAAFVENIIFAMQIIATFRKILKIINSETDPLNDFYSSAIGPIIEYIAKNIDYSRESDVAAWAQSVIAKNIVHPQDEAELMSLIIDVYNEGDGHPKRVVRVKGSGHSFPAEIYLPKAGSRQPVFVELDSEYWQKIVDITPNKDNTFADVTVRAGIHLGTNHTIPKRDYPVEITDNDGYVTTISNQQLGTLGVILWKEGWAFPDLGGIDHQTVGGFLSTGSAGGSAIDKNYDLGEAIMAITFIDGTGEKRTLRRDEDVENNAFFAAAVSMGMFGVITEVTFRVIPKFAVKGYQVTAPISEPDKLGIDFFAEKSNNGNKSVEEYLRTTDYGRLLWWPQPGVNKLTVWSGERFQPEGQLESIEYVEVGSPVTTSTGRNALQKVGAALLKSGDMIPLVLCLGTNLGLPDPIPEWMMKKAGDAYAKLLNTLFVADEKFEFQDYSFKGIPMDNSMDDKLIKVEFTELWIDVKDTAAVLKLLQTYYDEFGIEAAGNFCVEIYASAKSKFWLSPSFEMDVIRLDWFWFGHNSGDPVSTGFFPRFWRLLQKFNYRPHWGKYLPRPGEYVSYEQLYRKMGDWKDLREQYDPRDIFLTDYWSYHLDIKPIDRLIQTPVPKRTFDTRTLYERIAARYDSTYGTLMEHVKRPQSLNELENLMQQTVTNPEFYFKGDKVKQIRAVGTQYSYGRVAYVDPKESLILDTSAHLNGIANGEDLRYTSCKLKDSVNRQDICYVEAGATLEMVNNYLWPPEYRTRGETVHPTKETAFKVMKAVIGYSQLSAVGTTLVGAHGTGANTPPLADSVLSIQMLLVEDGKVVRKTIEPSDGITDPEKLSEEEQQDLIQDDKVFYTAVVSLGSMGVVYSMVFAVEDAYYVDTEIVAFDLMEDNNALETVIDENVEDKNNDKNLGMILFQNPYLKDGKRTGVMRVFKKHTGIVSDKNLNYQTAVPFNFDQTLIQFLTDFMVSSARAEKSHELVPEFLKLFAQLLQWPPKARSSLMDAPTAFDLGAPAAMKVNVSEVAKEFKDGKEAVQLLRDVCQNIEDKKPKPELDNSQDMRGWLTAPIIVELIGRSKAFLTESYGSDHVITMELPGFWEYQKTDPLQESVMHDMWQQGYRVHWGENIFEVTKPRPNTRNVVNKVQQNYPGYNDWVSVMRSFARSSGGCFINELADELINYDPGVTRTTQGNAENEDNSNAENKDENKDGNDDENNNENNQIVEENNENSQKSEENEAKNEQEEEQNEKENASEGENGNENVEDGDAQ